MTATDTLPDPHLDARALAVALGVVPAGVRLPAVPTQRREPVVGCSPLEASGWADAR